MLGNGELWGEERSMIKRFMIKFSGCYADWADAKAFERGKIKGTDHEFRLDFFLDKMVDCGWFCERGLEVGANVVMLRKAFYARFKALFKAG